MVEDPRVESLRVLIQSGRIRVAPDQPFFDALGACFPSNDNVRWELVPGAYVTKMSSDIVRERAGSFIEEVCAREAIAKSVEIAALTDFATVALLMSVDDALANLAVLLPMNSEYLVAANSHFAFSFRTDYAYFGWAPNRFWYPDFTHYIRDLSSLEKRLVGSLSAPMAAYEVAVEPDGPEWPKSQYGAELSYSVRKQSLRTLVERVRVEQSLAWNDVVTLVVGDGSERAALRMHLRTFRNQLPFFEALQLPLAAEKTDGSWRLAVDATAQTLRFARKPRSEP